MGLQIAICFDIKMKKFFYFRYEKRSTMQEDIIWVLLISCWSSGLCPLPQIYFRIDKRGVYTPLFMSSAAVIWTAAVLSGLCPSALSGTLSWKPQPCPYTFQNTQERQEPCILYILLPCRNYAFLSSYLCHW